MVIVRFPAVVIHGWPWGWGSVGIRSLGFCRLCGPKKKRKKDDGLNLMANGMLLCSDHARRTIKLAFPRPLDAEELSALRVGRVCLAVPMEDHLAQLYQ